MANKKIISKVLLDKNNCCLCFMSQKMVLNHVDDLVILDEDDDSEEVAISQILSFVFGDDVSHIVSQLDYICVECLKAVLASYRFIKKCKEKLRHFHRSVETLKHSFDNLLDHTDDIKTIIVAINTDTQESIQHYNVQSFQDTKTALRHFKSAVVHKNPKIGNQSVHNQDTLDIFHVIREENYISKVLLDKNSCCLCLMSQKMVVNHVDDLVILDKDDDSEEEAISQILSFVFGDDVSHIASQLDYICVDCLKAVLASYRFIKKCQEKLRHFHRSVETLEHCFDNLLDHTDDIKTIIVAINADTQESIQHYNAQSFQDTKRALRHFKTVVVHKKNPKIRKQRVHKQDTLDICHVLREENSNTKYYKCKICFFTSKRAYNIKRHLYSLHGAKLFQCELCTRSYGCNSLLKQHVNVSHSKNMCSECGKVYKYRYSLLYHMRLHSGELPYECQHCGVRFPLSSLRLKHIRRFHKEPSVECLSLTPFEGDM